MMSSADNIKRTLFVRHAESLYSAADSLKDIRDEDDRLTAVGRQQASQLADSLQEMPEYIVTSPSMRARETAQYLVERAQGSVVEVWEEIREFTYLEDGLTKEERTAQRKDYWSNMDPLFKVNESLESFSDLIIRVDRALLKLSETESSSIVLFSHAKFMRILMLRLLHKKDVELGVLMKALLENKDRFDFCDALEVLTGAGTEHFHVGNIVRLKGDD